jgi:hypothetical protein
MMADKRVLIFGHDKALSETRRLLLEQAGFRSDISTDLQTCQDLSHRYCLLILCHTVSEEEQSSIRANCAESGLAIYPLLTGVPPHDFVEIIRTYMLGTECVAATTDAPTNNASQKPSN